MAKLSINEITTYRWSFEEDVHQYRAAGIESIAVWRQKLSDYGEEKGVELLEETGLDVSSLLWAGGFTGSDGRSHQDSIADAEEALRLAAAMRAQTLLIYSGARGGHTHSHARRLMKSALSALCPIANEYGVGLAIEPMHAGCAAEWTFLTGLEDTLDLLEGVGNTTVKLAFDTYHLGDSPEIVARLPNLVDQIATVHLGDAREPPSGEQDRCRIGDGILPLAEIVGALTAAGYNGYYEIELTGVEFEAADYGELIAHSRDAFHQLVTG